MAASRSAAAPVRIIDDLETLRLMTQPVRLRIVETLRAAPEPMTVKALAAALGTTQTKLYYHVNLLEGADLVRVAATRLVSGIVEKRYVAAAYRLSVDRVLLPAAASGGDGLEVLLSIIFDQVRTEIRRSVAAGLIDLATWQDDDERGPSSFNFGRSWLLLTPAQLAEVRERLHAILREFQSQDPMPGKFLIESSPGSQLYELLLGFYPAVADPAAPADPTSLTAAQGTTAPPEIQP